MNFKIFRQFYDKVTASITKLKSRIPGKNSKTVQTEGMGVDLIKHIKNADSQISAIHDIKIKLQSDLHRYLVASGQIKNEKNKGIKFEIPTYSKNITVKALVYPNTIQLDIGCSLTTFANNIAGKKELSILLNFIWQKLCNYSEHQAVIEEPSKWILTHYHYGRDGNMEYDGEKFHITTRNALGEFVRAYSKKLLDGSVIVRIEKIKTTKVTVGTFLGDKGEKQN